MATRSKSAEARKAGTRKRAVKPKTSAVKSTKSVARGKSRKKISPSERWMLISRRVYALAQKRGFVGGDLSEDLEQAAREVDREYETDVQGLLKLTDPKEMVKQFSELFVSYGIGQRAIDRMLELNRGALEKLATTNQKLIQGRTKRSARPPPRLQAAAGEAIRALQDFSRGLVRTDELSHQLEQPVETIRTLLDGLKTLASPARSSASRTPQKRGGRPGGRASGVEFVRDSAVKAYHGMTPAELAEAPVSALRGLSEEKGRKLKTVFGIESVRDMAGWPPVERAASIVVLADAGAEARGDKRGDKHGGRRDTRRKKIEAAAEGPLNQLDGITRRQASVLGDVFNIHTVREMAENRFFRVAKAIVALADTEEME